MAPDARPGSLRTSMTGPITLRAMGAASAALLTGPIALASAAPAVGTVPHLGQSPTLAPRPASAPDRAAATATTLRLGSQGVAVRTLQQALGGLAVDGIFGPRTQAKVRAYQKVHHLKVTGVVDAAMWAAVVKPTASAPGLSGYAGTTLRLGSRGTAVRALQQVLGGLAVDGIFGPRTQAKVRAYQKVHHLKVTGVVDAATWAALQGRTPARSAPAPASAATVAPGGGLAAYTGTTLRLGSSGAAVRALQRALGGLTADGAFGRLTLQAVKDFQARERLTVTGVVDARTWQALARQAHPLEKYYGVVLREGARGPAVEALQRALGLLLTDGQFGPQTAAAVKSAQKKASLAQTGVVAALTWKAIEAQYLAGGTAQPGVPGRLGHGRGMSQWGAYGAAVKGLTWRAILAFYYPGTTLGTGAPATVRVRLFDAGTASTQFRAFAGLRVSNGSQTVTLPTKTPSGAAIAWWRIVRTQGASGVTLQWRDGSTWRTYQSWQGAGVISLAASNGDPVRLRLPSGIERGYRGRVLTYPAGSGVLVVNEVRQADYLASVVPSEMSASWPMEALRAQAVAARSFMAYHAARQPSGATYDTCDTTACQVYRGAREYDGAGTLRRTVENARTGQAIADTAGVVLRYAGKLAIAEFGASNGGTIAGSSLPYQVTKKDPYDGVVAGSPSHR